MLLLLLFVPRVLYTCCISTSMCVLSAIKTGEGTNGEGEWARCECPIYESAIKLSVMMDVPPFLH